MRTMFILTAMTLLAARLPAQSDSDYQNWMKTAAATSGSLQKDMAAKNIDAAVADAKKIEDTFKQVEEFWRKRNAVDAVNFAKEVRSEAAAVSRAATSGNMDRPYLEGVVTSMIGNLTAACGGCHSAHRERLPDGSFKMK